MRLGKGHGLEVRRPSGGGGGGALADLYIWYSNTLQLRRMDMDGGNDTLIFTATNQIEDLAVDHLNSRILYLDATANTIRSVSFAGTGDAVFITPAGGFAAGDGIAIDEKNGYVYYSGASRGQRCDLSDGGNQGNHTAKWVIRPYYDYTSNKLYYTSYSSSGEILSINPDGTGGVTIKTGGPVYRPICANANGVFVGSGATVYYWYFDGSGSITWFTPTRGTIQDLTVSVVTQRIYGLSMNSTYPDYNGIFDFAGQASASPHITTAADYPTASMSNYGGICIQYNQSPGPLF